MTAEALRHRFGEACVALRPGPPPPPLLDEWWAWLVDHYEADGRHYHTLTHLGEMVAALDGCDPPIPSEALPLTTLAALFHDAIYDPRAKDNETQSAVAFRRFADAAGLPPEHTVTVEEYILATMDHLGCESDDPVLRQFLDSDLAILGASPERYQEYAHQVRQEYAHLADSDFRVGRTAFLTGLLARPRLFLTDGFRDRLEPTARSNIAAELKTLGRPTAPP